MRSSGLVSPILRTALVSCSVRLVLHAIVLTQTTARIQNVAPQEIGSSRVLLYKEAEGSGLSLVRNDHASPILYYKPMLSGVVGYWDDTNRGRPYSLCEPRVL